MKKVFGANDPYEIVNRLNNLLKGSGYTARYNSIYKRRTVWFKGEPIEVSDKFTIKRNWWLFSTEIGYYIAPEIWPYDLDTGKRLSTEDFLKRPKVSEADLRVEIPEHFLVHRDCEKDGAKLEEITGIEVWLI